MNKKTLIITGLIMFISMLAFIVIPTKSEVFKISPKIKAKEDVTFFVATDIHYLAKSLTDNGEAFNTFMESGDGKQLNYIEDIVDAFIVDIKNKKPEVLILSGDLTSNGEKVSHIELAKKLKEIKDSGILVYVIPGNHDIFNPYARGFKGDNQYKTDYISDVDFSKIYGDFGYNNSISRDKGTLSYLATPTEDNWLLMLDTNKYQRNMSMGLPQAGGEISDSTFKWIEKCSKLAKEHNAKLITVMHQNLLDHVAGITKNFTIDNNQVALKVFQTAGLQLVLSGHIHIQDIKLYKSSSMSTYDIVTSALSVYPEQYGVLKYSTQDGFDYTTSKVDIEGYAKGLNLKDSNLINFNQYSKKFYENLVYKSAVNKLFQSEEYTDEQNKQIAKTKVMQKIAQNMGTTNIDKDAIINSEGFKLLETAKPNYLKDYLTSAYNNGIDNNKIHISN
ncbi:MAG: metallophosphoesterase [Clostridiaceae bacterium]|nr:metallophosphoesterase [Clostridiaceae bacterium]